MQAFYAVTISKDCTLYSCTEKLIYPAWRRHEEKHKEQFRTIKWFALKYLAELLLHGYWNSKYEIEARAAEKG